jgi:putative transposase
MKNAPLVTGQVYHIYSKSIADKVVFNSSRELQRMKELLGYYRSNTGPRFSLNIKKTPRDGHEIVQIICYCIMCTHIHLVLKQMVDRGVSVFMSNILNSYTRYFNEKYKRRGTLWEGRFKRILVENDEYLLHLTRYVHLNPVTARLVDYPEQWPFSSYSEYVGKNAEENICTFQGLISIAPVEYKDFVESRIEYQRNLAMIKHLTIDE